jgi:hypothetical protein
VKTVSIGGVTILSIPKIKVEEARHWLWFNYLLPLPSCLFAQGAKRLVVSPRLACPKQIKRANSFGLKLVEVSEVPRGLLYDVQMCERRLAFIANLIG